METNVIWETLLKLGTLLLPLSTIAMALIQYIKEKWGMNGKVAEIVSMVIGLAVSSMVAVAFVFPDTAIWIGVGLFVVVGTIAPSGGYKLLRSLLGKE